MADLVDNINVLDHELSEEEIKTALNRYHRGNKHKRNRILPDQSSYVVNLLYSEPMQFPSNPDAEPASTRGKIDPRLGAYTLTLYLNHLESMGFFDSQDNQH